MKRNIYVLIEKNSVECYSNLTKLIKNAPELSYYPIYRALQLNSTTERKGYIVAKTILK